MKKIAALLAIVAIMAGCRTAQTDANPPTLPTLEQISAARQMQWTSKINNWLAENNAGHLGEMPALSDSLCEVIGDTAFYIVKCKRVFDSSELVDTVDVGVAMIRYYDPNHDGWVWYGKNVEVWCWCQHGGTMCPLYWFNHSFRCEGYRDCGIKSCRVKAEND